jgi:hypothetical protein
MRTGLDLASLILTAIGGRDAQEPQTDTQHQWGVHQNARLWFLPDSAAPVPSGLVRPLQAGPPADAQIRPVADLPRTEDQRAASQYRIYPQLPQHLAIERSHQNFCVLK